MLKKIICCTLTFFMFCFAPKAQDRFFDNSEKAKLVVEESTDENK